LLVFALDLKFVMSKSFILKCRLDGQNRRKTFDLTLDQQPLNKILLCDVNDQSSSQHIRVHCSSCRFKIKVSKLSPAAIVIKKDDDEKKKKTLSSHMKSVIEDIIGDYDCNAKRIHLRLERKKYREKVPSSERRPTLLEIQNYITLRNRELGNEANIEQFRNCIQNWQLQCNNDDEELIVFGSKLGDEQRFNCGFTSMALLKQLTQFGNKGVYHIKVGYKIVKYFHPIITFGFTDTQQVFHPLAFMITSHKQHADFSHFFNSFIHLVHEHANIIDHFKPKFILVSEACNAMANAIATHFPHCVTLMCYSNVRYNVKKHKHLIPSNKYGYF
jgi:hypothetical protein